MNGVTKGQFSRLRWLVAMEMAARATSEAWADELNPDNRELYRKTAGQIHTIVERIKRRWAVSK